MKITACMIVKDSAATIEACLDSIRPYVDEICVYDTGSTDSTVALLHKLNRRKTITVPAPTEENPAAKAKVPLAPIKVKRGEWRNDFAWARQQSFDMAADATWLFWLDDDDVIVGAEHLRQLAMFTHQAIDGLLIYYDYARDVAGNTVCELWRERLLRNNGRFHWVEPVHEVWTTKPGEPAANFAIVPPGQIRFVHNRPAERYAPSRNLDILLEHEAKQRAAEGGLVDLRTLAYLGTEKLAAGDYTGAAPYLAEYLEDPRSEVGDERSQVAHKMAVCMAQLGNPAAAVEVEFEAIKERDDWTENAVGLCEWFSMLGKWDRVEVWAKRVLEKGKPQSTLILNPMDFTFLPLVRLAEAYAGQDRWDEARATFQQAAQLMPSHPMLAEKAQALEWDAMVAATVRSVLALRETLVKFDENLKAHELLRCVPYFVDDDPRIVAARAMQRENVMHAIKPEEYTRWYEDEPKESTVDDVHVPTIGDYIPRAKFVLDLCRRLEDQLGRKPRVLDLGCNDAWMAAYLWVNGKYVCDGVELNKASVEKAKGRVERFGFPGRIVQGDLHDAWKLLNQHGEVPAYDVVTMFEVYEHVPDTETTLDAIEQLVDQGHGYVCITTPDGAFELGNIQMWHLVERKGHLRAVPWQQFAADLLDRGARFADEDGVVVHGRLTYVSYKPGRHRPKVVFHAGGAWEPWSPRSIRQGGLGGSESALTAVAMKLAETHDVRVFSDADPGVYAGGLWRPTRAFDPGEEADAVISSRNPAVFDVELHAPVRALWCHDHTYDITERQADRMTDIVVLSDWHKARFERLMPHTADKLRIIRNGIILESRGEDRFPGAERPFWERKPHVVYSSSADRGLDQLLELWPYIRRQVADAELHIFYGWNVFDRVARINPQLGGYKAKVLGLIDAAGGEDGGVFQRGRVGQDELHDAMCEARVWAYPTDFMETSCITAMEARAAGLACVATDLAALAETVGKHGILFHVDEILEGPGKPKLTDAQKEAFAKTVVKMLTNEAAWTDAHRTARDGVDGLSWDRRVEEWAAMIAALVPA